MEKKRDNKITIVLRKDKEGKYESINEFIRRMSLVVRTALDKNENILLEGRGKNISCAFELAMSKNLENATEIEKVTPGVENVEFNDNGIKKKRRMANVKIVVKKKMFVP